MEQNTIVLSQLTLLVLNKSCVYPYSAHIIKHTLKAARILFDPIIKSIGDELKNKNMPKPLKHTILMYHYKKHKNKILNVSTIHSEGYCLDTLKNRKTL